MQRIERALIVGGGIAGCAAALALTDRGVACTILERRDTFSAAGVGIGLHSPPLRALKAIGLFETILRVARPQPEIVIASADGVERMRIPQPNVNGPGDPPFVNLSRATLHALFADAVRAAGVDVRLGTSVERLDQTGDTVEVVDTAGAVHVADLLVGADGLHSRIRDEVLPTAPHPTWAGQAIWRLGGTCPPGLTEYTIMVAGEHRIGLVPLPGDELYLWMLDSTMPEHPPRERLLERFQERMRAYGGFAPAVAEQAVSDAQLDLRALQTVLVPPPWHERRVVLIGDAVHAATPQLAWGAGLAIEDAVVLGELVAAGLSGDALGEALTARRFERCRVVVEGALQLSRWEQAGGPPRPEAAELTADAFRVLTEAI